MKTLREIGVKNCPEFVFNNMTNINNLDTSLISINRLSFRNDNAVNYKIEYSEDCDFLCISFLMM